MQTDNQLSEIEKQRKGRMVFLLMVVFFVVPIIVVILMYKLDWKPSGNSLGELINPPRMISSQGISDADGVMLQNQFWQQKWSVVYVTGECEKKCQDKLRDLRQLHVSLYKDIQRVQRVLITSSQDVASIKQDYPDLIVLNQPDSAVLSLAKEFQVNNESPMGANRVYLVDSLGYLMMSYPESLPLADVRKDVTRLLRYSWAG